MLGSLDIVVGLDEQPFDARLDVLSDIPSLCKRVAVADGKGYIELLAQGPAPGTVNTSVLLGIGLPDSLEDVCLPHAGRADQK